MHGLNLEVVFTARELEGIDLGGSGVVVTDILRATTTITAALAAGACAVIPAAEVDEARMLRETRGGLLGGERGGVPPRGFDLGNSPAEYVSAVVKGQTVILTTSNGTTALAGARAADWVVVGCFNNLEAVASGILVREPERVIIACSGTERGRRVAPEDVLFAGELLRRLEMEVSLHPGGGALVARDFGRHRDEGIYEMMKEMPHARRLIGMGAGDDVRSAAELSVLDLLPVMQEDGDGMPVVRAVERTDS